MVVYSRTEKGKIAAYSGDSTLPRKLKSLLRVIDGKTDIEVYVRNLHAFGDVREILLSLEMAGLLSSNNSQSDFSQPVAWENVSTFDITEVFPATATNLQPSSQPVNSSIYPGVIEDFRDTQQQLSQKTVATPALKQATGEMADFILTHAPGHAFQTLKELDDITSLEELAMTMGGYSQMIEHCGEEGKSHLDKINEFLRSSS